MDSLFDNLPDSPLPDELFDPIATGNAFTLKRIISTGQLTDWHNQADNEWLVILKGSARLLFDGEEEKTLKTGDCLLIPAQKRHRVTYTENPTVWLVLHFED